MRGYCKSLTCYEYEELNGLCSRHQADRVATQAAIIAELTPDTALLEDDPLAELCFEKFQKLGLTPKGAAVLRPYDFNFGPHTLTLFQYWVLFCVLFWFAFLPSNLQLVGRE